MGTFDIAWSEKRHDFHFHSFITKLMYKVKIQEPTIFVFAL